MESNMNKRKMIGAHSALALLALAVSQVHAADPTVQQGREDRAEKAAQKTLAKMTMEEKLAYIGGTGGWDVKPLTNYGVPQIHGADGGVGVRYTSEGNDQGVVYPSGPNLAATFNPRRAIDLGRALGYDTAVGGYQFITGPGVNLYRMPFGGRAFEYLSGEDPFLGASLAPGVINGIQSRGVWANAKHYAANDQESNRFNLNQTMPERVLREMSLPAFESSSKNGNVAMMMCAFQKVNGEFACESEHLIAQILKKEWGFKGFVQSDYNAVVHGFNAARAGTDLDMMGYQMNSSVLKPHLDAGDLSAATIDDKVRRILKQIYLYKFDSKTPLTTHNMNSSTSNKVALNAAREGIVLLKNQDNLLPLDKQKVKKIAVVGTLAKYSPPTGFGSANVMASHYVSELSGLQQIAPNAKVDFIEGLSLDPSTSAWTTTDATGNEVQGMKAEYFSNTNWSGDAAVTRTEKHVDLDWANDKNLPFESNTSTSDPYTTKGSTAGQLNGDTSSTSIRYTGKVTPTQSGEQVFKVRADGAVRLWVNGKKIIDNGDGKPLPGNSIPPTIPEFAKINLEAGQSYDVKLEYSRRAGYLSTMGGLVGVQLSSASLNAPQDLSGYDAVVVAVGNSNEYEGEGFDHSFDLPEFQNELIQNIAKVNPNTVVTMYGGTGLKMSDWIEQVPAALHAFYPGQNGGQALAEILFGKVNPSGKLPISIERNIEDNPAYASFPKFDNQNTLTDMDYKDDLLLGYRGYEKKGIKPLYPFGYGMSYTTFGYSNIKVTPGVAVGNTPIKVSFDLSNTGKVGGSEVAQLYVGQQNPKVERPIKELKGYKKVFLKPGESKRVTIELNDRSLAYFDEKSKQWVVDADTFNISLGSSSQDIRLNAKLVNSFRQELSTTTSNPLPRSALNSVLVEKPPVKTGGVFKQTVE
ncbi:Beta-glucosidase [Pseudomonas syringae pv. atrofaciens]|nr:Beta-glucosidase [Pseudomonas syringae pv. aptata]RMM50165.1 Beta-glucosidase [Pseudomonas syringae pv. atrofaciens]RMN68302.1 Beta-glucosidase [Pseudomonas syringae]RMO50680.1 Beta-glucosidase [Pseudomonas syringae]RMU59500.1 Beta-glucosidase [Pseudomonas syringae pv. syringae]